jgi:hypothetical protein
MSIRQLSPQRKNASGKHIISSGIITIVSVCLTVFVLELGARLLPPPYDPAVGEFFACNSTLGWIGAPNFEGTIEDPSFHQELTFNSLGMHDTEHPLEKPPDVFRILLLGDSFVQAVQVNESETAHQVLEDYLNEQKQTGQPTIEVLSSGVINWGTNQHLVYYREQGHLFQPDLVLLAFYLGNDFSDNLPGNVVTTGGFNCYAPYFAVCNGNLNPTPLAYAPGIGDLQDNCSPLWRTWVNSIGRLFQYSRLYQQIEPLIMATYPRQQFGQSLPSAFSALYFLTSEIELEQAWQVTLTTIAQLQQEVEADGTNFAVVLISPDIIVRLGALSQAEQEVFIKDNPLFADAQADKPNQRLAKFLDRHSIAYLDLQPPMTEHLSAHQTPLYILGEGHWTVEGNRVAAEIMGRWLIDDKVIPNTEK